MSCHRGLLQRDRPRQWLQHRVDYVIVDHIVANFVQPVERFDVRAVGGQTAVLAGGDVDAELLFLIFARANLVGVGARFHADAAVQATFVVHGKGKVRFVVDDRCSRHGTHALQGGTDAERLDDQLVVVAAVRKIKTDQ